MKLKKIASLALAGVMAVSMLTACGSKNETKPEGEGNGEGTTASGYSAMLGEKAADTLNKADNADLFTFADDSDDQKALKKVIVNSITESDVTNVINYVTIKGAWDFRNANIGNIESAFNKEVGATSGVSGMNSGDSVNTEKFASVGVANGNIAMDTVIDEVFSDIKVAFEAAKKDGTVQSVADVNYTYTVSVSVENVPVTYNTTTSGSLNFISVKVTRAAELV